MIPQDDALFLQLAAIAGGEPAGGLLEVRYRRPRGGMGQLFHNAARPRAIVETIQRLGASTDVYVGCAPRRSEHGGRAAIQRVWALWADCDGPEAVAALEDFRPRPAVVVRSGTGENRHAFLPLRAPLTPDEAKSALRRLAHHLGADMAAAEPARILRPPGTRNFKTDPPASVECTRLEVPTRALTAGEIVGDLPDPPAAAPVTTLPRRPVQSDDPLLAIAPEIYVEALTGRPLGPGRKIPCPLPGHEDRTPSCQVYAGTGWHCFGCGNGGSIYDLAGLLWGYPTPLRGHSFVEVKRRLLERFGRQGWAA